MTMEAAVERAGVADIRNGHGRQIYFDVGKITTELLESYFERICPVDTGAHSLPLFRYAGEIDVANKIGDVKDHAR